MNKQRIHKKNIKRILMVEQWIMCPLKIIVVLFSAYFLSTLEPSRETYYYFSQLKLYVIANLFFLIALIGIGRNRFRPAIVRIGAFFLALIDNLYLSFLIFFTGGLDSELYLLYPGLLIRNAINFPEIKYQQTINATFILFYIGAVYSYAEDVGVLQEEIFFLRIAMLVLVSFCCWGIYFLIDKKNRQLRENQELTIRTEKLHIASQLACQIAHELKNPLGIINNAAYLIGKKVDEKSEKIIRQVDIIQQEVRKSDRIISELLDYSRLAEGKIVRVNINQYLMNIVKNSFSGIDCIEVDLDHSVPELFIDEYQFVQLMYHLVMNAHESFEGINRAVPYIRIRSFLLDDETVALSIADNGSGIEESHKENIFTPFYSTKSGHVGLGMSIVKNITHTYNGTISIESAVSIGTTVTVTFPLHTVMENEAKKECQV